MRHWTLGNVRLACWLVPTLIFVIAMVATRHGVESATDQEIGAALPGVGLALRVVLPVAAIVVAGMLFAVSTSSPWTVRFAGLVAAWLLSCGAAMVGLLYWTLTRSLVGFVVGYAILMVAVLVLTPARYGLRRG